MTFAVTSGYTHMLKAAIYQRINLSKAPFMRHFCYYFLNVADAFWLMWILVIYGFAIMNNIECFTHA